MAPTKEGNSKGNYQFVRRDGQLLRGEEAEEESANVFAEEVIKEIKDKQREENRLLRFRHPAFGKDISSVSQDTDGVPTRHSTKDDDGEEKKTSRKRNTSAHAVRKRVLSAEKDSVSTEVDDQAKAFATGLNLAALTADVDMASLTFSPQATAAATGLEGTVLTAQAHGGTVETDVQAKADVKGAEVVAGNVDARAVDEHLFVGAEALVSGADVKVGNASVAAVKMEHRAGATFEAKGIEVKAMNVDAAGVRQEQDVGVYVGAKAVEVSAMNARVSGAENKVEARAGVELALLKVGGFNQESDTVNHAPMLDFTLLDLRVPGKGTGATTVRAGGGAGSSSNSGTNKGSSNDGTHKNGEMSKTIEGPVAGGNCGNGTGLAAAGAKAQSNNDGLNVNGNNTKVSPTASGNTETRGNGSNTGGKSETTEEKVGTSEAKSSLKANDVQLRPVVPKGKIAPQAIHVIPTSVIDETRQDGEDKTSGRKNRAVISQNDVSSRVPRVDGLGRTPTLRHTVTGAAVAKGSVGHQRGGRGRTGGNSRLQGVAVTEDDGLTLRELHQHGRPHQLPSITRDTPQTQSSNRRGKMRPDGDRLKEKTNRDDASARHSAREKQRLPDQRTTKPLTANRGRRTPASPQPKFPQTTGKQHLARTDRTHRGEIEPQTTTRKGQTNGRHTRLDEIRTPARRTPGNDARKGASKSAAKGKRNPENSAAREKLPPLTFNDRVLNKVTSEAGPMPARSQPPRPTSRRRSASKFQALDREALRNRLLQKYAPSQSAAAFDKTGTASTSSKREDKAEETVVVKKKPTGLNKNIHGFDTLGMETSKGVKRLGRNIHGFGS
ncbi:PREDICTED: uncharacterized protein LOC109482362 [Branchiostoma belcheri]|uniref:Uncharacterized protein LOC109482362 n=1 Tax=Branchiostoma belcheri TaxID=7741 RepID=A0A6P4ZUQ0_BRABE|nr:PREDICTED: uncharacterized protein LOC109482362 [Branchiostoma belcheri]